MADKNGVVAAFEDDSTFELVKQKPRKAKEPEASKPPADKKKKIVRPLYKDFSKSANGKEEAPVQEKPRSTTCYNCQGEGHLAKDCKEEKKPRNVDKDAASAESKGTVKRVPICFNCNTEGHVLKECPEERKSVKDDRVCYKCNETGHIATKCPSVPSKPKVEVVAPVVVCHKCNAQGHLSKDCTQQKKPEEAKKCFRCNQPGHAAYNCPQKSQNRR